METILSDRVICTLNKKKRVDCFFQSISGPNKLIRNIENIEVDEPWFMKRDDKELFFSADPGTKKLSCGIFTTGKKSNINCIQIKK